MKNVTLSDKLDRLLRHHRQHVFDDGAVGERHERALHRLKRTRICRQIFADRKSASDHAHGQRLLQTYA